MITPPATTNPRVINCATLDDFPGWEAWGPAIRKIVLGPSPGEGGGERKPLRLEALPPDLAVRFPRLTHLYLWQIEGLRNLPTLPSALECLDTRGCADLTTLPPLPDTLETLVLDGCGALEILPTLAPACLPKLTDLSLKGCAKVPEAWIHHALQAAPALRLFEASDCPNLSYVPSWPPELERIELNGCPALKALPAKWPPHLRRVGLRGAAAIPRLPDFPDPLDYADLAATAALRSLPALPPVHAGQGPRPRTLFLHGSGVLMPPASEHGRSADENVAARTRAYFEDVALAGPGQVKRCKLLLLGNGSAGKTCLALRLVPGKDPHRDNPGTTHGVQFWDWDFAADVAGGMEPVHLHLWDFGGQEIYHNTHRLFMGKGAVFVVLWWPDQDGQQPPEGENGYQDEWRPLQYWLDLIHLACPHQPRIAIVCSHRASRTAQLEAQWRQQVTPNHHDCPCFYLDSLSGAGEVAALEKWLREEVGQVVHTQGVVVPSYWEIAQSLVQSGLPKTQPGSTQPPRARRNHLSLARFGEELQEAIRRALESDREGRYPLLATALAEGRFQLTPDRLQRTLDFLTHSGWVYWDRDLFESRVIIGQQWALDGIYTVLERRQRSLIYRELRLADGQFTRQNLHDWAWQGRYSAAEQRLLISFMQAVDVCFQLVPERESRWREPVFKSFEHLPHAKELDLQPRFDRHPGAVCRTVTCPRLHKGHWQALLKDLGERYGTDARYAVDGFYLENQENQAVYLAVRLNPANLGGEIRVQVAGPDAANRAELLETQVRRFLPEPPESKPEPAAERAPEGAAGTRLRKIHVFFSYAWDPPPQTTPTTYEEPVQALEAALPKERVEVHRDKQSLASGENILTFMQRITQTDKVVVVHSDKYWVSPFCIYEFWLAMRSFLRRRASMADVLILIEHPGSGFGDTKSLAAYERTWQAMDSMPSMLAGNLTLENLKEAAHDVLTKDLPEVAALLDRNRRWPVRDPRESPAAKAAGQKTEREIIQWALNLIGIEPPQPR